ncbi:MAG: cytochrome c oxidase assembly protein [Gammaproteobacteria bacterium]|nr:cytochrome c oxidase assembly protein [Gammaproteobacteria bacterium]
MTDPLAKSNKRLVGILSLITLAMLGFGFALVPLYDLFCDVTGLNGKTGVADAKAVEASRVDTSRWVTVEFTSQVNGLAWEFRPMQNKIRVHPGEAALVKYYAHNRGLETAAGNAVPSVSPGEAAAHFKKVQCFCFTRQELKAGESREMPVQFLVEYDLPKEVKTLTLSYVFFNADKTQAMTNKDEESNASPG